MPARHIAVAAVHGMGRHEPGFADDFADAIRSAFHRLVDAPDDTLVIRPVHWAPALDDEKSELRRRLDAGGRLDWPGARDLVTDFLVDAIAYQQTPHDHDAYDRMHARFALALQGLADDAGPEAPLCVVAHSLGSIIASNFLYDCQAFEPEERRRRVRTALGPSPLEQGDTLALLYTLGSPLGLWSLRYEDFGLPIRVPAPAFAREHADLGGWFNLYDPDDPLAWPLRGLNEKYAERVREDLAVDAGRPPLSWTPVSHMKYWEDRSVAQLIAEGIARCWEGV